jgi:hypothetical protein
VKLPVVWLPEADAELKKAVAWYAEIRRELGDRFARAVDEAVEAIASNPLHFAIVEKVRRRAGVHRFLMESSLLSKQTGSLSLPVSMRSGTHDAGRPARQTCLRILDVQITLSI